MADRIKRILDWYVITIIMALHLALYAFGIAVAVMVLIGIWHLGPWFYVPGYFVISFFAAAVTSAALTNDPPKLPEASECG